MSCGHWATDSLCRPRFKRTDDELRLHSTVLIIAPHDHPAPTKCEQSQGDILSPSLRAPTERPWLGSFVCETPWLNELEGLPLSIGDTLYCTRMDPVETTMARMARKRGFLPTAICFCRSWNGGKVRADPTSISIPCVCQDSKASYLKLSMEQNDRTCAVRYSATNYNAILSLYCRGESATTSYLLKWASLLILRGEPKVQPAQEENIALSDHGSATQMSSNYVHP